MKKSFRQKMCVFIYNINVCYFGQIIQISTLKFKIFKGFFSVIIKKTLYLQNLKKYK